MVKMELEKKQFTIETEGETAHFEGKDELIEYIAQGAARSGGFEFIDRIYDEEGNEYGVNWSPSIEKLDR